MKIGFIDYFISEWHSNNYPNWIKEITEQKQIDAKLCYAYADIETSPVSGVTTDQWCEKFSVEKCNSIEEICEKSDALFILSPNNPEKHLEHCKVAFKYGKPFYVDKTFTTDLATAKQIFEIAEKYNTPMFSSSALRFADEISDIEGNINSIITTGGGNSLEVYIIHQLEMIVKIMDIGAKKVICTGNSRNSTISVLYDNDRHATLNFSNSYGFSVSIEKDTETNSQYKAIISPFFINLLTAILEFFVSKNPPVSKAQTLEIMAIRDACIESLAKPLEIIEVVK